MSCSMMKAEPLSSLSDWIAAQLNHGYSGFGMEAPSTLYNALQDCLDCRYYDEAKIYLKLYELNARAYSGRYSTSEDQVALPPPEPYKPRQIHRYQNGQWSVEKWHYKIASLLSFFLYQCNEDETYNDALYLALNQLHHNLYCYIVDRSEEMQSLPWGE